MLSPRSCIRLDSILFAVGKASSGSFLLAPEWLQIDSLPSMQSSACFELPVSALDFLHLEPISSLRSLSWSDFNLSPFGKSRMGFSLLVLDPTPVGFSMLLQSFIQLDPTLPVVGICELGFPLFVLDYIQPGLLLLPKSFSYASLSTLVLDFTSLGSLLSLRSLS